MMVCRSEVEAAGPMLISVVRRTGGMGDALQAELCPDKHDGERTAEDISEDSSERSTGSTGWDAQPSLAEPVNGHPPVIVE